MSKLRIVLDRAASFFKCSIIGVITGVIVLPASARSSEISLQVAFVYNFIKFIDWPTASPTSSLKLCVLGASKEMHEALDQLQGKAANKQVIELVYLHSENSLSTSIESCQMVFRSGRTAAVVLPNPLPKGVVLVSNEPSQDGKNACIVMMRNNEGRIEFEVNQAAVTQAGIKISSQLLKLAKNAQAGKSQL